MKLIGMLDSPYVRRVAVSMQFLDLPYEHQSLSVFRNFDQFQQINPVVKAPSLVCDDGTVLMDSQLILEYLEVMAHPRTLIPATLAERKQALRVIGLALAACEKSVQILYERLRPAEKMHEPWIARVTGQLFAAYGELEKEISLQPLEVGSAAVTQASVTAAVAWYFTQRSVPGVVPPDDFPALVEHSVTCEALPEFAAVPYG